MISTTSRMLSWDEYFRLIIRLQTLVSRQHDDRKEEYRWNSGAMALGPAAPTVRCWRQRCSLKTRDNSNMIRFNAKYDKLLPRTTAKRSQLEGDADNSRRWWCSSRVRHHNLNFQYLQCNLQEERNQGDLIAGLMSFTLVLIHVLLVVARQGSFPLGPPQHVFAVIVSLRKHPIFLHLWPWLGSIVALPSHLPLFSPLLPFFSSSPKTDVRYLPPYIPSAGRTFCLLGLAASTSRLR